MTPGGQRPGQGLDSSGDGPGLLPGQPITEQLGPKEVGFPLLENNSHTIPSRFQTGLSLPGHIQEPRHQNTHDLGVSPLSGGAGSTIIQPHRPKFMWNTSLHPESMLMPVIILSARKIFLDPRLKGQGFFPLFLSASFSVLILKSMF